MTTYRSSPRAKNIVESIRKTLLNYELAIANAESIIAMNSELMDLFMGSTKKDEERAFLEAKIDKENYEVLLYRLRKQKYELLAKVELIANKYEGDYSKIFTLYFFQQKTVEEIAELLGMKPKVVDKVVYRIQQDIIEFA